MKALKTTKVVAETLPATRKGATGDTWGDLVESGWEWCKNGSSRMVKIDSDNTIRMTFFEGKAMR